MLDFVSELSWRGMVHSLMPGTEEMLRQGPASAYVGIDPTADSLHIGHLVGIMMLRHFQRCGHKPIALLGGATGMIGDPSMKSQERNLLSEDELRHNQAAIRKQLEKFLDFNSSAPNAAELVNNYDWMKNFTFLEFIRDIGKHITVNYMMAKDSVKKRLSGDGEGMSFTEFTYQLVQGYDFLHLYKTRGCKLQMGGSDQWGNITTGTELIRRTEQGEAFALTCPLITKADGGKFGKTESGNVWLDPKRTSPYAFYQFWLNTSDEDAAKYIKIFTFLSQDEVEELSRQQQENPHLRPLQRRLAQEVTSLVHSEKDVRLAEDAAQILFGNGTEKSLSELDEETLLAVLDGVPQFALDRQTVFQTPLLELLSTLTNIFPSKAEARRMIQSGGVALNKVKLSDPQFVAQAENCISGKYLLIQRGKKNYYLIILK